MSKFAKIEQPETRRNNPEQAGTNQKNLDQSGKTQKQLLTSERQLRKW